VFYAHDSGDDHLDADTVILRARREKREKKRARTSPDPRPDPVAERARNEREAKKLARRRDELTERIETSEARVAQIDEVFCGEGYYERTPPEEIAALERERAALAAEVDRALEEWTALEERIELLTSGGS
jgi:hypothetical protein